MRHFFVPVCLNKDFKQMLRFGRSGQGTVQPSRCQQVKQTMKPSATPAKIIESIQDFYNGKEPELIYSELAIDKDCFDSWIRDFGIIANELMELRDENEKLRLMFTNLSLVNQSLRSSLDSLTRSDSKLIDLLIERRKTGSLRYP